MKADTSCSLTRERRYLIFEKQIKCQNMLTLFFRLKAENVSRLVLVVVTTVSRQIFNFN